MAGHWENRQMERTPQECFRCISEDHLISECPKSPKENEKQQKQVRLNDKYNRVCDKNVNNSDQKIY